MPPRVRVFQDSSNVEIGSGAGGSASYLTRAQAKASLSPIDLWEEQAISTVNRLALGDETSLYGAGTSRSRYCEGGSTGRFERMSRRDRSADSESTTVVSTWSVAVDMFSGNKVQNSYCGV